MMNTIRRNKLIERKSELGIRKLELQQLIQDLKIPNYRSPKILEIFSEQLTYQRVYAKEIHGIEKELSEIKTEFATAPDEEKEVIKTLIKDTFGIDFLLQVISAVERINEGEEGVKLKYVSDNQKEIAQLKSKVIRLQDVILESRKQLTNYINSHEQYLNKSDFSAFLTSISKVNQSIPHHSKVKDI
jgi:Mg2+ and Co2+ transporter CorA